MTSTETASASGSVGGSVLIGALAIAVGAGVIPYGASMPYIREGIPGPGLFLMMIGGLLVVFGTLLILTSVLGARRDRRHAEKLAELSTVPTEGSSAGPSVGTATGDAAAVSGAAETPESATAPTVASASVPHASDDAEAPPASVSVMDTDIGSDGPRRWLNGAILLGSIVFFVLAAEPLGFPLTMAILVFAIVLSLRARWWVALLTGVLTSVGLWLMFEQGLMVQLPDGIIQGF